MNTFAQNPFVDAQIVSQPSQQLPTPIPPAHAPVIVTPTAPAEAPNITAPTTLETPPQTPTQPLGELAPATSAPSPSALPAVAPQTTPSAAPLDRPFASGQISELTPVPTAPQPEPAPAPDPLQQSGVHEVQPAQVATPASFYTLPPGFETLKQESQQGSSPF